MARVTGIAVSPSGQVLSAGHIDFLRIPAFPVGFGGDTVFPDMIRVPIGSGGVIDFTLIEGAYAAVWSLGRVEVEFAFTVSDAADIQFNEGLGAPPMPDAAPAIVAQGSVSPASGAVGTQFTFTAPVVSGRPTPVVTRVVTLNGSPVTVNGNSYTSTSAGALAVAWTATNGVGSPATSSASATVTAAGSAPVITQQPSVLPAAPRIGDNITIDIGAASGSPAAVATWDFTRDGVSIKSGLTAGVAMEITAAGVYVLSVSWANGVGNPVVATVATFTVAESVDPAIDYAAVTQLYIDENTPYTGSESAIETLTPVGLLGRAMSNSNGTQAIQKVSDGWRVTDGSRLQTQVMTAQAFDGLFIVADVTIDAYGSAQGQIVESMGARLSIRNNNGSLLGVGPVSGQSSVGLGAASYGERMVIAVRYDAVSDIIDGVTPAGAPVSAAHNADNVAPTQYLIGRFFNGVIHRVAIVAKPVGGEWPITLDQVHADFSMGV